MPRPTNVGVGTAVIIENNDGQVLLLRRKGARYADLWSVPGGWVDASDTTVHGAAQREVLEETGMSITIDRQDLFNVHTETDPDYPGEFVRTVTIYFLVDYFGQDEPRIMEPDKCSDMRWFHYDELPPNLFPGLREQLDELA